MRSAAQNPVPASRSAWPPVRRRRGARRGGRGRVRGPRDCERRAQLGTLSFAEPLRAPAPLRLETCLPGVSPGPTLLLEAGVRGSGTFPTLPQHLSRGPFCRVPGYSGRVFILGIEGALVLWATIEQTRGGSRCWALRTFRASAGGGAGAGGGAVSVPPPAASETRCGSRQRERRPRE